MAAGKTDEAEARFRELLPLISFLIDSVDHLLCYGKRLAARRLGLGEVNDRAPGVRPEPYGLEVLRRLAKDLEPFDA